MGETQGLHHRVAAILSFSWALSSLCHSSKRIDEFMGREAITIKIQTTPSRKFRAKLYFDEPPRVTRLQLNISHHFTRGPSARVPQAGKCHSSH